MADATVTLNVITNTVTERDLAAAFTEWDRRYREEPERFQNEAARLLRGTPETYGEACAPYLLAILAEQRAARATSPTPPAAPAAPETPK